MGRHDKKNNTGDQSDTANVGYTSRRKASPTFKCENCGCMRYKPCTCSKGAGQRTKDNTENKDNG